MNPRATSLRALKRPEGRAPVRLAQGTDSLRLLRAFAAGAMYYDPGSACARPLFTVPAKSKKRSQFRVASRNIHALYESVETVEV